MYSVWLFALAIAAEGFVKAKATARCSRWFRFAQTVLNVA